MSALLLHPENRENHARILNLIWTERRYKMGNMSYCRFQNTLGDLRDCEDALYNEEELSEEEETAKKDLIALCMNIAETFGSGD
jgi:hypothetical protein